MTESEWNLLLYDLFRILIFISDLWLGAILNVIEILNVSVPRARDKGFTQSLQTSWGHHYASFDQPRDTVWLNCIIEHTELHEASKIAPKKRNSVSSLCPLVFFTFFVSWHLSLFTQPFRNHKASEILDGLYHLVLLQSPTPWPWLCPIDSSWDAHQLFVPWNYDHY